MNKFPNKLIPLIYSEHAKSRLIERTTGSLILAPQYIRLTKDNTIDIKIKKGKIYQATAVIDYKYNIKMHLPILLNSGIVKTIYFRNVKKNRIFKENIKLEEKISIKEEYEDKGRETERIIRTDENVGDVSGNLGRENRYIWKSLFRTIRTLFRQISA